jgi:ABC-type phosphonate transport system ATPase subunit
VGPTCETDVSSGAVVSTHSRAGQSFDGTPRAHQERFSLPVIVGVAGGSGSGKTSIAELIAGRLGPSISVLSISSDNYYISLTGMHECSRILLYPCML